ncbi:MAG: hypothetical protein HYX68_22350 [Planctomycetes bacterium]|nr:hypothetical protein [Planctomycetota bacterium]
MSDNLKIMLEYRLNFQTSWIEHPISVQDYFDPEFASKNEVLDIDNVPLHDHGIEYLDVNPWQVVNTRVILRDESKGLERRIVETFWNDGRNRLIERTDMLQGHLKYWEVITDVRILEQPTVTEILRVGRKNGILAVLSHVFITDNEDGSQTELQVHSDSMEGV